MKKSKIILSLCLASFVFASGESGVKHRKVFTTTIIGEHLSKEEMDVVKKQKEANVMVSPESNVSLPIDDNESKVDNRTPIEKITGSRVEVTEKPATNPIVDITRQAPVITDEMRNSFKNQPSSEFKPK